MNLIKNFFRFNAKILELEIKKTDLALNEFIKPHLKVLQNTLIEATGCKKDEKRPETIFYITVNSALNIDRIEDLKKYIDIYNIENTFKIMDLANKGNSNKAIVDNICSNEA